MISCSIYQKNADFDAKHIYNQYLEKALLCIACNDVMQKAYQFLTTENVINDSTEL